jgi:hypothetical protein
MEERLRTAETSIEVLKNKTKVSERRISDLERIHEKTMDKLDLLQASLNRGVGILFTVGFGMPVLVTAIIELWVR